MAQALVVPVMWLCLVALVVPNGCAGHGTPVAAHTQCVPLTVRWLPARLPARRTCVASCSATSPALPGFWRALHGTASSRRSSCTCRRMPKA